MSSAGRKGCRCSGARPPASWKRPAKTGPSGAEHPRAQALQAGLAERPGELFAQSGLAQQRAEFHRGKRRKALLHIGGLAPRLRVASGFGVGGGQYHLAEIISRVAVEYLL